LLYVQTRGTPMGVHGLWLLHQLPVVCLFHVST